jgi:spore coat polysaccharide biosynthesis predicted glycosyltransferase SpsG
MALYQALLAGNHRVTFVVNGDHSVLGFLQGKRHVCFDWRRDSLRLAACLKTCDAAVIDSYLADEAVYCKVARMVSCLVSIDDFNRLRYPVGIVTNGLINANRRMYRYHRSVKFLLGSKYALLRSAFWNVPQKRIRKKMGSIMVTFGGDDMRNMTPAMVKLLVERYPFARKIVVVGRGFANVKQIRAEQDANTDIVYYPDARGMKRVMALVDCAVSAGGQTLHEFCRMGVPVVAVTVAQNQVNHVQGLAVRGLVYSAGWYRDDEIKSSVIRGLARYTYRFRNAVSKRGQKCIDGQGALRIVAEIENYVYKNRGVR